MQLQRAGLVEPADAAWRDAALPDGKARHGMSTDLYQVLRYVFSVLQQSGEPSRPSSSDVGPEAAARLSTNI